MRPDGRFVQQSKVFWANVRTISQTLGYTMHNTQQIKVYSIQDMLRAMQALGLSSAHLLDSSSGTTTEFGALLEAYFQYRADVLHTHVEPRLMTADRARATFEDWRMKLKSPLPIPMNKQKGEKRAPAYLTGLTNMLIEAHCQGLTCDYNPGGLTTVTRHGAPLRTLARRVDGCFPSKVNPVAVWEIKEYYYTTSFGSRVADGVYETLLDGLELEELREHEGIDVQHLLIIDAYETWWLKGRSYLCRLIDMLHMGYVDEVLFGGEIVERLPKIVEGWVGLLHARTATQ